MKWRGRRTSRNIVDRRGRGGGMIRRGGRGGLGGALGGILMGGRRGGRGLMGSKVGMLILAGLVIAALVFGFDPLGITGGGTGPAPGYVEDSTGPNTIDDEREEFVAVVLADTEEVWEAIFRQRGGDYVPPTLVLFEGSTPTACGLGQTATGPFYCPADRTAYLDMQFFGVLESRLGAGGDFAKAYVIAHEVAHHVQTLIGVMAEANRTRQGASEVRSNEISVMIELQADCFSGVWARQAEARFGSLDEGDIEEALNAAAAIGDDTLQRRSGGEVVPDSFTHGTSAQRVRWFRRGYESGEMESCDTFGAARL